MGWGGAGEAREPSRLILKKRLMLSFKMTRVCSFNVTGPVYKTSKSESISYVDLVDSSFQETKDLRRWGILVKR